MTRLEALISIALSSKKEQRLRPELNRMTDEELTEYIIKGVEEIKKRDSQISQQESGKE